jgi:hypothetical protein
MFHLYQSVNVCVNYTVHVCQKQSSNQRQCFWLCCSGSYSDSPNVIKTSLVCSNTTCDWRNWDALLFIRQDLVCSGMIRLPVSQRTNLVCYVNTSYTSPPQPQVNLIDLGISDYSNTHKRSHYVLTKGYSCIPFVHNAPTQAKNFLFLHSLNCTITNLGLDFRDTILCLWVGSYMSETATLPNVYPLQREGTYHRYKTLS